ncbi:UNVERIFIED_CONTAM: LIM and senescent cell antigen-like-containing domain protein 2 [Gekko kuhli]
MSDALANAVCERCHSRFDPTERIVNSNGELYHENCFVCAQCFRQFPEGLFYEFEGRKYCEHDFQMLFAPCCGECGEFIIGRVIKAMNNNWHPECFRCEICDVALADLGFVKNAGSSDLALKELSFVFPSQLEGHKADQEDHKNHDNHFDGFFLEMFLNSVPALQAAYNQHLCRPCHNREKAKGLGKYICQKCHLIIDEQPLMFRNDSYHPDHFSCTHCGKELTADARELKGELYCLPCHDKMGIPICGACRRPIEGRVVNALGKQWHVEHFVCAKCEKPFLGHRHYEKKGLAYCETHYNQLFGDVCYNCSHVIEGDVVSALNKAWCVNCFSCSTCNIKLTLKNKFVEFDMKPVCKKCYEKFPLELKKRLKKLSELATKKTHPKALDLNSA